MNNIIWDMKLVPKEQYEALNKFMQNVDLDKFLSFD